MWCSNMNCDEYNCARHAQAERMEKNKGKYTLNSAVMMYDGKQIRKVDYFTLTPAENALWFALSLDDERSYVVHLNFLLNWGLRAL